MSKAPTELIIDGVDYTWTKHTVTAEVCVRSGRVYPFKLDETEHLDDWEDAMATTEMFFAQNPLPDRIASTHGRWFLGAEVTEIIRINGGPIPSIIGF